MSKHFRFLAAVCLAFLVLPAIGQDLASKNNGITLVQPAGKAPAEVTERLAPLPSPLRPACDGANYTTNSFNDPILMGGPIVAIAWTPAITATINRVEVFTGESTAPIALGIWSDSGTRPLADLGDTGYFNLPSTVNSWQGKDLLTNVSVTAGTKYWIVFDPSGGEQAPVQNGTGQQYWGSYTGTISSVPAASWFGPFSSSDHAWKFRVFCAPTATDVYAAKFLCGDFLPKVSVPPTDGGEWPIKPGDYFTVINIHNPNHVPVRMKKKAVLLYRGDQESRPEQPMPPGKLFDLALEEDWGTEIDCTDIRSKLLASIAPAAPTFIEGWFVIEVSANSNDNTPPPLDVTGVYTSHGWDLSTKPPRYEGFSTFLQSVRPDRIVP